MYFVFQKNNEEWENIRHECAVLRTFFFFFRGPLNQVLCQSQKYYHFIKVKKMSTCNYVA